GLPTRRADADEARGVAGERLGRSDHPVPVLRRPLFERQCYRELEGQGAMAAAASWLGRLAALRIPSMSQWTAWVAARRQRPVSIERDLRLDFFRGLSLFFIFIDHIPNNFLSYATLHTVAFADAAEVFIFISGYTAALVYGQLMVRRGALVATVQIYYRVWPLYVAHIFIFMIYTAEVSYATVTFRTHNYSAQFRLN